MRVPLVVANWKMNTTVGEAEELVRCMLTMLDKISGVEKVLCPPFVSLTAINRMLQGSSIKLGAQNMHFEAKGAYTGEVSPLMLRELCEFVILGHSERRWYFHETGEMINKKVKAALSNGLKPILCVGERLEEQETGRTEEVVREQLTTALNGIKLNRDLAVAYEPVWAIGTGKAASSEQAAATTELIRSVLANLWNEDVAQDLRILYGGSVTRDNVAEFVSVPEIDGALVGGASLKVEEFFSIVNQASEIKNRSI
jgi:triosephosphate isomerase (TIM)